LFCFLFFLIAQIHFNPTLPYIVGSLLTSEEAVGLLQVRLKKHRWVCSFLNLYIFF
jgi:hypothetical protein